MDPAPDPLAFSASAPFPTIPAASSPRPRAGRPRRHAAPFRSDHPAAAAIRRSGIDLSRRPVASAFAQQESSPSVGSWGASRGASFVFGSGAAGAPEMRRCFSSGSGEAFLTDLPAAVDELALDDGSGRQWRSVEVNQGGADMDWAATSAAPRRSGASTSPASSAASWPPPPPSPPPAPAAAASATCSAAPATAATSGTASRAAAGSAPAPTATRTGSSGAPAAAPPPPEQGDRRGERETRGGRGPVSPPLPSATAGRRSDADAPGGDDPEPVMNANDPFCTRGSNSSLYECLIPDSLHDQTEKLDEGSRAPSQTVQIQCDSAEAISLASPTCSDHDAPIEFARFGDSLSVDEGSLPEDGNGSKISAHCVNVQRDVFVFGGHAGYRDLTANATQTSISKVDSADKDGVPYNSGQLNASVAKDSTCTKFILQDAKHAFGSTNKNPLHSEPCEISSTAKFCSSFGSEDGSAKVSFINVPYDIEGVEASELNECRSFSEKSFTAQDHNLASKNRGVKGVVKNRRTVMPKKFSSAHQISSLESVPRRSDNCSGKASLEENVNLKVASSFALSDSGINCAQGNSYNSALQIADSSHGGTEFTSLTNTEHSGQSDFIFSASTFNQSTLHSQRRHSKKKSGGMCNHANSIQSLPSSAIGPARSEVSASQQCAISAAQWTEYSKMEPNRVTVCTKTENFEHHEDCETWHLRGNQAYAEGQLTKAEECYTHGIDSFSPNEASKKALMLCYSNRAATRMSLGKMREALSDCREAIGIDSSFLKAQVRAANCLLALGDVEEAQKAFEMCLKSNHLSSLDHKIVEEASDGLQKAQKISGFIHQSKEYLIKKAFDKIPSALQMISDALFISIYSDNLMAMKAEALLLLQRYEEVIRFCEETLYVAERNSLCLCPDNHSESNNLDNNTCSVKLWRYHLIAKSYFFFGKLEEAHQFLKKYDQVKVMECRCGKQSQESISSFSMAISELLRLKAAGNEAFQSGKYLEAVEHYTTALLSNSESLRFLAVCFCNRAAAYQAMGQILDAIADCSLAIALDADYAKAISRRSSLYELIRDYDQAENDLRRLITLLEKQLQENMSMPSEKTESIRSNLNRANLRFSSLKRDARKGTSLNVYLILGIEPSSSAVDIKKAYRKAALRHHPDKAGKFLVKSENISDAVWGEITNEIRKDADYLFKIIGKAYSMLSDLTMRRE